jgi:hypothetical protein
VNCRRSRKTGREGITVEDFWIEGREGEKDLTLPKEKKAERE